MNSEPTLLFASEIAGPKHLHLLLYLWLLEFTAPDNWDAWAIINYRLLYTVLNDGRQVPQAHCSCSTVVQLALDALGRTPRSIQSTKGASRNAEPFRHALERRGSAPSCTNARSALISNSGSDQRNATCSTVRVRTKIASRHQSSY